MRNAFNKYPQVILVDSTYKAHNLRMPLYFIINVDGCLATTLNNDIPDGKEMLESFAVGLESNNTEQERDVIQQGSEIDAKAVRGDFLVTEDLVENKPELFSSDCLDHLVNLDLLKKYWDWRSVQNVTWKNKRILCKFGKCVMRMRTFRNLLVQNLLKDNDLDKIKLVTKNIQDPPPWIIGQAKTSSNIKHSISKKENPHIIKTKALEYIDNAYKNHLKIYTDGSKDPASGKTGYAFLIPSRLIASYKRTSDNLSVYTTEMTAIYQSLKWLFSNQQPGQKVVILTDSYSAIQSIQNNVPSRPDILEPIQILACRLKQKNIEVTIELIPAHVGILGNEQVDKLAELALSNDKIDLNLSLSANEFIAITTALYKKKWQARWDNTYAPYGVVLQ
ncbi:unnamed protein product [Mytilus coruscus]|uniref:RNase H type-1 domain-containing protein n=1 Tax=Mytilus coruscus TaxID=42192 RepID=A0A6J8AJN1_MYTCO|nr:unnamed protein product [Mytilus coruscus]